MGKTAEGYRVQLLCVTSQDVKPRPPPPYSLDEHTTDGVCPASESDVGERAMFPHTFLFPFTFRTRTAPYLV